MYYFVQIEKSKDEIGGAVATDEDLFVFKEMVKTQGFKITKLEKISKELYEYIQDYSKALIKEIKEVRVTKLKEKYKSNIVKSDILQ